MENKERYHLWTVKVSEKGQISIPKQAREIFNIKTGDTLLLLGDTDQGLAIVKYEGELAQSILNSIMEKKND